MEGLEELRRAFRELPAELQKRELAAAVSQGAKVIRDDAAARAPVLKTPDPRRTAGLLRRMIRATRGVRNGSEASAFVSVRRLSRAAWQKFKRAAGNLGAVNPNDAFYWRFVEFGTSKVQAQPFLRPAFDSKKMVAAEKIKTALRESIERVAKTVAGKRFR